MKSNANVSERCRWIATNISQHVERVLKSVVWNSNNNMRPGDFLNHDLRQSFWQLSFSKNQKKSLKMWLIQVHKWEDYNKWQFFSYAPANLQRAHVRILKIWGKTVLIWIWVLIFSDVLYSVTGLFQCWFVTFGFIMLNDILIEWIG